MKFNSQHIEQYLLSKGCVIQSAFFENSTIKSGSEFLFDEYRVIYRIEQRELIICSLEISIKKNTPGNFLALFNFLHKLGKEIADISIVRMLVIDNIANQPLRLMRSRLIRILIAKGAFSKNIDGNDWLLFDVSTGK